MKIIGFNFTKILVERKDGKFEKPKITQNIDIKDVVKEKSFVSNSDSLRIVFNFNINYTENQAKLEFEGNIILMPENNELNDFLKSWKGKKIPEESRIPLFNFIMNKCNVKALSLEDEFGLPIHVPLPRLTPNKSSD
jgi:hypothetical protein